MRIVIPFCILFSLIASCIDDDLLQFSVSSGDVSYIDCMISVDLSVLEPGSYESLQLFEEVADGLVNIPFQLERSSVQPLLWFKLEGMFAAGETRRFSLRSDDQGEITGKAGSVIFEMQDAISIRDGERPILEYRTAVVMPPDGVDPIYRRSGFIHPLWSPGGEVLTRIQPPDHYHHYGIWNPWAKTHIAGREIDYWNLAKGQGTVRYAGLHYIEEGKLFSQVGIMQEHVDLGSGIPERVTMEEELALKYWGFDREGSRYILDKTMSIRNVLSDTILFDAYRYGGGIGYRATEKWNAENCTVLTSEGKERTEADGSKARWCIVEGESSTDEGRSGILFLSHPDNREHPEPMRVWPLDSNNGELFFEFCPIRNNAWEIVPGISNALRYRMVVFDGTITPEEAEMYWNSFAHPPVAEILN